MSKKEDLEKLTCRWQVSVTDPSVSFKIDHVYVVPASKSSVILPLNGFIMNSGFEISTNSIFYEKSNWNFPLSSSVTIINKNVRKYTNVNTFTY